MYGAVRGCCRAGYLLAVTGNPEFLGVSGGLMSVTAVTSIPTEFSRNFYTVLIPRYC